MSFCSGGFPTNDFFEDVNENLFTVSFNTSPLVFTRKAKPAGNFLTGYYSDKATCNRTPGALPGQWTAINQWQSTCHGVGVKRELTSIELFGNACGAGASAFCNSLTDQGGNPRKPIVCGGTDPNIFTYNPTQAALAGLQDEFGDMSAEAGAIANKIILEQRKKIWGITAVIIIVAIIIYLILKF